MGCFSFAPIHLQYRKMFKNDHVWDCNFRYLGDISESFGLCNGLPRARATCTTADPVPPLAPTTAMLELGPTLAMRHACDCTGSRDAKNNVSPGVCDKCPHSKVCPIEWGNSNICNIMKFWREEICK